MVKIEGVQPLPASLVWDVRVVSTLGVPHLDDHSLQASSKKDMQLTIETIDRFVGKNHKSHSSTLMPCTAL